MRLAQTLFFFVAAVLAIAVGAARAEDKVGRDDKDPGFNTLDQNNDGYVSRAEALANPELSRRFKQADRNGDGKLSRTEYLVSVTKQDARTAKRKVDNAIERGRDRSDAATGGSAATK